MLKKVEASGHIKAPSKLVYSLLTGYESYSDWNPDIVESRVLAAEGEVTVAEFISPPFGAGKLILEFVESPGSWVSFHQVDRYRAGGLSGRWEFEGNEDGSAVVVKGVLSWKGGILDFGQRRSLRGFLDRTLDALTTKSQFLGAMGGTVENGGRRRILDIVRKGRSLDLDLDGERYRLSSDRDGATP